MGFPEDEEPIEDRKGMRQISTHFFGLIATVLVASLSAFAAPEKPVPTLRVLQLNAWQEGTSVPGGVEKIAG